MLKKPETGRPTKILDAAERAFADFGFEGASMRHIVRDAGVNLPTVYYYFTSKEGLMEAVFNRRFGPMRQEQLDLLRQFEEAAQGRPLPVEKVLKAMILPALRLTMNASAKSTVVMRLVGRVVTEPNPQTQELLRNQYKDVRAAFIKTLQRSLPKIPLPALYWRLEFVWGALARIMCNPGRIEKASGGLCNPYRTEEALDQMTAFFSAGFRAAPAS